MKKTNKRNGSVTLISLIFAIIVIIGLVIYMQKDKTTDDEIINEEVVVLENKSENVSTTTTGTESDKDIYQNGEYQGELKKVYKNNDGSISVDIDFFQLFIGKKAFLEHAKDIIYSEENKNKSFVIKEQYSTYLQLEKFIKTMNENDFQSWYNKVYNPDYVKIDYDPISNVIYYNKNESKKIRTFILDKNVIIGGFESESPDNEYYDYYSSPLNTDLDWDYNFIIKNGVIKMMDSFQFAMPKLSKKYNINNDKIDLP